MVVRHALQRYFPNAPDWVIGGLILVIILWITVLPIEILQALTRQNFLRPTLLGWIVRSLYIYGFGTSLSLVSPWTTRDVRVIVVPLGLLIASPLYFGVGVLLSTRKAIIRTLGILILIVRIIFGCIVTATIMFSAG
jgi:hypothetical protein